ncbi:MFS transporter [Helicobacter monodelphidis]|uniref:MFS transporter n=1 Tax=Helicobacter sp. 15-1451 TaxID=2004995 RepID=UPI000DCBC09C|nr:MFS transporter [Helicobacter sp. 15-1451]RAX59349.1 MFS transporter [Helicobacter sp. 15-1451]
MKQEELEQKNRLEKKLYTLTHRPFFQLALFLSTSMTVLGSIVIAPTIPQLEAHFHDVAHIDILARLTLTLPALFVMIFSPISGYLLDRFGRIKFLIPSMFAWSIGGSIAILWDNIYWILFSRAIFGIATAFVMTSASALVADYYSGEDRQRALGLQGFAAACGSATFMVLGGFLAHYDWRYPFFVYGFGILIAILATFYLFEPKTKKYTTAQETNQTFTVRPYLFIYFVGFIIMASYYVSPTQVPSFITNHLHESPDLIGISMSASSFSYGLSSLAYIKIRKILSAKMIYVYGFLLMGVGFLLMYIFCNIYIIAFALLLTGLGGGPIMVNNSSVLLSDTPQKNRAKAMGILSSLIFFGQFISPILSQPFVRNYGTINLFLVVAFILFVMALLSFIKK